MTTQQAKKIVTEFLVGHELPFTKLTARTVGFSGFGYGDCLFVKIHGWQPCEYWDELRALARSHGFRVE